MSSAESQTVQICYSRYDCAWPHGDIDELTSLFPEPVRGRILQLKRPARRQASIMGKLLLLHCLGRAGDLDFLSTMTWSPNGRPALPGQGDFNITHTRGMVACAHVPLGRVGIDAETERSIKRELFINFASPSELKFLQRKDAEHPRDAVHLWVRKEAVLKADGRGFTFGATKVNALTDEFILGGKHFRLEPLDLGPGLVAYLASEASRRTQIETVEINPAKLAPGHVKPVDR